MSAVGGMPENVQTLVQRGRLQHTPVFLEAPLLEEISLDIYSIFLEEKQCCL